jgi:hypothetical protein
MSSMRRAGSHAWSVMARKNLSPVIRVARHASVGTMRGQAPPP